MAAVSAEEEREEKCHEEEEEADASSSSDENEFVAEAESVTRFEVLLFIRITCTVPCVSPLATNKADPPSSSSSSP